MIGATIAALQLCPPELPRELQFVARNDARANHPGVSNGFHFLIYNWSVLKLLIGSLWTDFVLIQSKILYQPRRFNLLKQIFLVVGGGW